MINENSNEVRIPSLLGKKDITNKLGFISVPQYHYNK